MCIRDRGNFGEFLGAIAVVATLFYLALQVRHTKEATEANTRSLEEGHKYAMAQAYQARADSAARLFNLRDPDVFAKLWSEDDSSAPVSAEKIDDLSASEVEVLRTFMWAYMLLTDNVLYQRELGLVEGLGEDPGSFERTYTIWKKLNVPIAPNVRTRAVELGFES